MTRALTLALFNCHIISRQRPQGGMTVPLPLLAHQIVFLTQLRNATLFQRLNPLGREFP